jgi:flagellar biosynthesis/type III secretory pathway protein FliH
MTRFPYDQFSKDYFQELLQPLGKVETSLKVPAEIREIDIYFTPSPESTANTPDLGLLGQFANTSALFEPFRNPATRTEIRSCINKLLDIFAKLDRQAKTEGRSLSETELPRLWIICPTVSKTILNGFRAYEDKKWGNGVYLLADDLRTAIIAVHKLPRTEETLWLRLLGKGKVKQQALEELQALPVNNPLRAKAIDLLLNLKTTLELRQDIDQEDRDFIMQLSPIYEQRLAEAAEKGQQQGIEIGQQQGIEIGQQQGIEIGQQQGIEIGQRQGIEIGQRQGIEIGQQQGIEIGQQQGIEIGQRAVIENLLRVRFGSLDEELRMIIESISQLAPEEFTPLLLQLSREQLLDRFRRV